MNRHVEVVIVGAGPVGLFLACCLKRAGIPFVVLEKRYESSRQSRAIGIHPPALELMERAGLADRLIERGLRIRTGAAYCGRTRLGEISFGLGAGPFGFVLSLPQRVTERVLLEALPAHAVHRGAEVTGLADDGASVLVSARGAGGCTTWHAGFVAGCDGMESTVRGLIGSSFDGADYPDRFAMGDFTDATGWPDEGRIFLDAHGFIESFPLPGGIRRWVLHCGRSPAVPDAQAFARTIRARCGEETGEPLEPLTNFGCQHFLASSFARGRVALAGDAAHVMSPFGGQGMNVGWLDAWDLAEAIARKTDLPEFAARARARAGLAIRRAGQNLAIGRGLGLPRLRTAAVSAALRLPLQRRLAERFTMRGL